MSSPLFEFITRILYAAPVPQLSSLAPGLAVVACLTAVAYLVAQLPGLATLGPLVSALLLGMIWRMGVGARPEASSGIQFCARTLLRIGVVLLGIRLNFALLAEVGWLILLANLLVVAAGLISINYLGRWMGLSRSLRLSLAIGTSICGASAIAAATALTRARASDVSIAIGVISIVGTAGVFVFPVLDRILELPEAVYGLLVGATLQEVGQVVAAGYAYNAQAGDLATAVKLSRVALLAPVLLLVGLLRDSGAQPGQTAAPTNCFTLANIPAFVFGFLAVGIINSLGMVPPPVASGIYLTSVAFTSAAMAAIGLSIELNTFRRGGTSALMVGGLGFTLLIAIILTYGITVL